MIQQVHVSRRRANTNCWSFLAIPILGGRGYGRDDLVGQLILKSGFGEILCSKGFDGNCRACRLIHNLIWHFAVGVQVWLANPDRLHVQIRVFGIYRIWSKDRRHNHHPAPLSIEGEPLGNKVSAANGATPLSSLTIFCFADCR